MDVFDYDGLWWDVRHPEKQWVGRLHFDRIEGVILTVTVPRGAAEEFFPDYRAYDVILGLTTAGEPVSLLKCFERSSSGSMFGFPRRIEVFANSAIVGFHCQSVDPLVSIASASFHRFNDWWGLSAIQNDKALSPTDTAIRYSYPDPVVIYDSEPFNIAVRSAYSISRQRFEATIREDIRIEIRAASPRPFSEFREIIQACEDFISIACLGRCGVEKISLLPPVDDEDRQQVGSFCAIPLYRQYSDRSRESLGHFLFQCSDIRDRLQTIFTAWFNHAQTLKRVRSLYFSGVYGSGFLEGKLLALVQAAEAFHRRFYPGEYMDREEFQKSVFEPLRAAIPIGIDPSLRQSMTNRLKFGNEHSLRRRMIEMVSEHEAALAAVVDNPKQFVNLIVEHRNDFTHHPPDLAGSETDADYSETVLRYNYVLRLLLEMCFLKAMGFSKEEILSLSRRCGRYQQISQRFFRKLPASEGQILQ